MSVRERLDLIGQLWDSVEADFPLEPDLVAELEQRRRELESKPGDATPADEVLARIRSRLK